MPIYYLKCFENVAFIFIAMRFLRLSLNFAKTLSPRECVNLLLNSYFSNDFDFCVVASCESVSRFLKGPIQERSTTDRPTDESDGRRTRKSRRLKIARDSLRELIETRARARAHTRYL